MVVLLWLNAETLERVLTPLIGRLVRCSGHGRSFARLRYIELLYFADSQRSAVVSRTASVLLCGNLINQASGCATDNG